MDLAGDHTREGAGHRRADGQSEAGQDGRRGAVERQSVQRLYAARKGVDRRRAVVRLAGPQAPSVQRFRAGAAGRRVCEMIRAMMLSSAALIALPAAAQDIAITNVNLVI